MNYPKLIHVDSFPVFENGERYICLRDPQNPDTASIIISELAYYLLTYFDGKTSIDEVISNFNTKFGKKLDKSEIENLLDELDRVLLIENEKYNINRSQIETSFLTRT
ncbi:MAG: hypothetical protein ACR2NW_03115 [Thermodesulfobacteriota bacterium]